MTIDRRTMLGVTAAATMLPGAPLSAGFDSGVETEPVGGIGLGSALKG